MVPSSFRKVSRFSLSVFIRSTFKISLVDSLLILVYRIFFHFDYGSVVFTVFHFSFTPFGFGLTCRNFRLYTFFSSSPFFICQGDFTGFPLRKKDCQFAIHFFIFNCSKYFHLGIVFIRSN